MSSDVGSRPRGYRATGEAMRAWFKERVDRGASKLGLRRRDRSLSVEADRYEDVIIGLSIIDERLARIEKLLESSVHVEGRLTKPNDDGAP